MAWLLSARFPGCAPGRIRLPGHSICWEGTRRSPGLRPRGTREKQFSPEALGNAKIHLIIIFDGGGERGFLCVCACVFFKENFLWHHKIKGISNPGLLFVFPRGGNCKGRPLKNNIVKSNFIPLIS